MSDFSITEIEIPSKVNGGIEKVIVTDEDVVTLLSKIYNELKKANTHLSMITDHELSNIDLVE